MNELVKKDQKVFKEKMTEITRSIENLNVEQIEIPKEKAIEAYKLTIKFDRDFAIELRQSA